MKREKSKEEMTAMKPVQVYFAEDRIEAEMLIDILKQNGIPAYRQGAGLGEILDVYAGNSSFGENIFVDEADVEQAAALIEGVVQTVPEDLGVSADPQGDAE